MKRTLSMTGVALIVSIAASGTFAQSAQSAMGDAERAAAKAAFQKQTEVGAAHRRLDYFVGRWNTQLRHHDDPGDPGFAEFTMELGGRHLRQHLVSRMGRVERFEGVGYFGYDNRSQQYYHLWMEDFFSGPFLFAGRYDAAKNTYTLPGELGVPYQSYAPKDTKKVQEVIRVVDQDHFVIEWHETVDGKPKLAMTIEYTRAK